MRLLNKNSTRFIAGFLSIVLVTFLVILITNTFEEESLITLEVHEECDQLFC